MPGERVVLESSTQVIETLSSSSVLRKILDHPVYLPPEGSSEEPTLEIPPVESFPIGGSVVVNHIAEKKEDKRVGEASGDKQPLHEDEEYARNTRFGANIHHGVSTITGLLKILRSLKSIREELVWNSFGAEFRGPVQDGNLITTSLERVGSLDGSKRCYFKGLCLGPGGKIAVYKDIEGAIQYPEEARRERFVQNLTGAYTSSLFDNELIYQRVNGDVNNYEGTGKLLEIQTGDKFLLYRTLSEELAVKVKEIAHNRDQPDWTWEAFGLVSSTLAKLGGETGKKGTVVFLGLQADMINDHVARVGDRLKTSLETTHIDLERRIPTFGYDVTTNDNYYIIKGSAKVLADPYPYPHKPS